LPDLLPPAWRTHLQQVEAVGRKSWNGNTDMCAIDVVQPEELTAASFIKDYLSIKRPLLIRGGAKYMPALERWSNLRYLKRKAGSTQLSAVTIPYPEDFGDRDASDTRKITLKEYIDGVMGKVNSTSNTPLYVFSVVDQNVPNFKKLLNLVDSDAGPHPQWLEQNQDQSKFRIRFGNTQFGLGPAGSGAPQHYHTHAYASLFSGSKRWWFFPPPTSSLSRKHAVKFAAEDAKIRAAAVAPSPTDDSDGLASARASLPLVCEQVPGDIVYVPSEWGHLTLNTAEMTVSVSREFTWDGEETDSHVINSLQV